MPTGTLGTTARDYPTRESVICYTLDYAAAFGAGVSIRIGTIPANCSILRATTSVSVAFNSSTTNNIQIGNAAGGAQLVAAAAIGLVNTNNPLTLLAAAIGPLAADTPVWITGTFAAAAPTAGHGTIAIEWVNPGGQ